MSAADTIFALATPPGKSGVAVLRLSGPRSLAALQQLTPLPLLLPRIANYVTLRTPGGDVIDKALAIYFKAPESFTGEDIVELHTHGSLVIIKQLLGVLAGLGLRPAEPGEFSRRAFINGKMDLIEAEGLADLIESETVAQKTQAMRQLQGEMSGYYEKLREKIIHALANLEAYIDFPDEEIPESVLSALAGEITSMQALIGNTLNDQHRGERMRDGISVVILGAPNVGKSSLLNAIARRDAAIVSARAGTTRDIIEVHMDIAGYPVVLVDTAGIREASDDIEEEGVRRALARAQAADIKLVMFDGSLADIDKFSQELVDKDAMVIISKSDIQISNHNILQLYEKSIPLSTKTGQGIEPLLEELEQKVVSFFSSAAAPFITRHRHRALLAEALHHLGHSMENKPLELKCEELRLAAQAVGKITGKIQVDEVLDVVFRQFCIGK